LLSVAILYRPDQKQMVKKYTFKLTLKELSLKAVIDHKNHFLLAGVKGPQILRKKLCRNLYNKQIKSYTVLFTAASLKNMLLKKITENFRKNSRKECASEELCYFMATLVHGELFSLRVPMLRSNPPLTDENVVRVVQYYNNLLSAAGMVPPSLSEVNQASRGIRMLLNAIETECSSLRSLHLMSLSFFNPLMPLTNDSSLGTVFFRALHRLTNLHIDCYECDDWALMQFATHATNLV